MSKLTLTRFFVILVSFYFLFIALAIIFIKTGFINYKNLAVKYWTDEKEFYYALNTNKSKNFLTADDRVKAGWVEDSWGAVTAPFAAAAEKVKFYTGCVENIQGTVNCMATGVADTSTQVVLGGTISACKEAYTNGQTKTEECDSDGAVLNYVVNADPNNFKVSGGALGLVNYANSSINKQTATLVDVNYYAAGALSDIPFFGKNIANAATPGTTITAPKVWVGFLDKVSLGEIFYKLWIYVRNLSYVLIVIPTVVLGFAIMFKFQIGQQTQVTLLGIIPKLLIVLLLITFSYPISALIVQMAEPMVDIISPFFSALVTDLNSSAAATVNLNGLILAGILAAAGVLTGGLFLILLVAVVLIGALAAGIKYLYAMVVTVVTIGFLVAFSPLIFLMSAFPGKDDLIKQYFLNLIANVFGLTALSIIYLVATLLLAMGTYLGSDPSQFLVWIGLIFVALGLLWKSSEAPKKLAAIMGAKPLLDMGGGDPRKR